MTASRKRGKILLNKTRKIYHYGRGVTKKCASGEILRDGYEREGYTRTSGTHVKSAKVAPACIEATGLAKKTGKKGKKLFILKKGSLRAYGYESKGTDEERHNALMTAMADQKPLSVYRRLMAIGLLNRNRNPTLSKIFYDDAEFIKGTDEYKATVGVKP